MFRNFLQRTLSLSVCFLLLSRVGWSSTPTPTPFATATFSASPTLSPTFTNVPTPCGAVPIINTIGGNGSTGYSGDGGQATTESIYNPIGVAVDPSGNLYIADMHNNRIRKITSGGIISTIAGNGTAGNIGDGSAATSAEMNTPYDVAVDSAGNIYFSDANNNRIREISTGGIVSNFAGSSAGTSGNTGDGGPATSALLNKPSGLAFDNAGNLYIVDINNSRVRKVSGGVITNFAGSSAGTGGDTGDGGQATSALLQWPYQIVFDSANNAYISDFQNSRVRKVNTAGVISNFAGSPVGTGGYSGDGGPATSALLTNPVGVAVDAYGNLFIGDSGNNVVRMVNSSGVINTAVGTGVANFFGDGGPAATSMLNDPWGIALDDNGSLYICDNSNYRVRKVGCPSGTTPTPAPTKTSTATISQTFTPNLTPTRTPSISPTFTASPSISPTFTESPSISPTFTASPTISPTFTESGTVSPTFTESGTVSPTFTESGTVSPTFTESGTVSPTFTESGTVSPTFTESGTVSPTFTESGTVSPTFTESGTVSPTFTESGTVSPTFTESGTVSPSISPTRSFTLSQTPSISPTDTPTLSPTKSPTPTFSFSHTKSPSPSPIDTKSATVSVTPSHSKTSTSTSTTLATPINTETITPIATAKPNWTHTSTPTITTTPLPTATVVVPVVTNRNVFHPTQGDSFTISIKAPQNGELTVKVFSISGELVRIAYDSVARAGIWNVVGWDGKNSDGTVVASGIYFVSVRGGGIRSIKKVIVLR